MATKLAPPRRIYAWRERDNTGTTVIKAEALRADAEETRGMGAVLDIPVSPVATMINADDVFKLFDRDVARMPSGSVEHHCIEALRRAVMAARMTDQLAHDIGVLTLEMPWLLPDRVTPDDVLEWEHVWKEGGDAVLWNGARTPIEAARAWIDREEQADGEPVTLVYGPDRLGRVMLWYAGERLFARHAYRDGVYYAGVVVVGKVPL
jgi:hypothetical protein